RADGAEAHVIAGAAENASAAIDGSTGKNNRADGALIVGGDVEGSPGDRDPADWDSIERACGKLPRANGGSAAVGVDAGEGKGAGGVFSEASTGAADDASKAAAAEGQGCGP